EIKVTVLAITDHDTTDALPAAHHYQQANNLPLTVINGVEISTLWEHHEIHIVGLNIDITHPAMTELLAQQSERRRARGMLISERLAKAGIE
ncbi:PHP domain-containing protein, partial [Vibrio cholerae]